jgi:hypothetical protein
MSSAHGTRCASTATPQLSLLCSTHTHTHTHHTCTPTPTPAAGSAGSLCFVGRPPIIDRRRHAANVCASGEGPRLFIPRLVWAWSFPRLGRRQLRPSQCVWSARSLNHRPRPPLSCTQPTRVRLPSHNVGTLILLAWELHQAAAVCCRSLACRPARGAIAGTDYRQGPYQRLSATRLRLSNRPPHLDRIIASDASHCHCQR